MFRRLTDLVYSATCNLASLVPRPTPSFPSLAVRLNRTASDGKLGKRREAGRGPGNEAITLQKVNPKAVHMNTIMWLGFYCKEVCHIINYIHVHSLLSSHLARSTQTAVHIWEHKACVVAQVNYVAS